MKLIYMAHTLGLINSLDPRKAQELIPSGTIKQTEEGTQYLLILE